jgi:hypothetical protein
VLMHCVPSLPQPHSDRSGISGSPRASSTPSKVDISNELFDGFDGFFLPPCRSPPNFCCTSLRLAMV